MAVAKLVALSANSLHTEAAERRTRHQLAGHVVGLEAQVRGEFAGQRLHRDIAREAGHVERVGAAVAGGAHDARQQFRADALAAPVLLDAERGFDRAADDVVADRAQFARAPQRPVDVVTVDDVVDTETTLGITRQKVVVHRHGEAIVPALGVETQEMIPERGKVGRP